MLKIQICWSILRYFGYDDNLNLTTSLDSFAIDYDKGESLELSSAALDFLQRIYTFGQTHSSRGEAI